MSEFIVNFIIIISLGQGQGGIFVSAPAASRFHLAAAYGIIDKVGHLLLGIAA